MPRFPPESRALLRRLREVADATGVSVYLVGGAVRDALLGRPTADIDLAVAGDPHGYAEALARTLPGSLFPLDAERRMYRVAARSAPGYVDIAPLRGDIQSDALERDFTINALAVPLGQVDADSGQAPVLDPLGGLDDLDRRHIHAVGDGVFADDPVRLLRAVRIAAELAFDIEPVTMAMAKRDAHLIRSAAAERVRDELCRTLAMPNSARHLRLLDELRLLTTVIPELEESRGVGQPKEHYWDVLQHCFEAVGFTEQVLRQAPSSAAFMTYIPWDGDLAGHFQEHLTDDRTRMVLGKVGALLHDVAKPRTKTIGEDGRMRFLGHSPMGAEMTERILERLRFSRREVRMVSAMVREHLRPGLISRDEGPSRKAVYRYFRDAGEAAIDTLFLSFADYLAARGPLLEMDDWRRYAGKIEHMLSAYREKDTPVRPLKLIDGHDLIAVYHLEPGPRIGELLEAVREGQAAGELLTREDALAYAGRLLAKETAAA